MSKFLLLDKVVYLYTDYDKPVEYPQIGFACSGHIDALPNSHHIGCVYEIEETTVKGYDFEDGEYEYTETRYGVTGLEYKLSFDRMELFDRNKTYPT